MLSDSAIPRVLYSCLVSFYFFSKGCVISQHRQVLIVLPQSSATVADFSRLPALVTSVQHYKVRCILENSRNVKQLFLFSDSGRLRHRLYNFFKRNITRNRRDRCATVNKKKICVRI